MVTEVHDSPEQLPDPLPLHPGNHQPVFGVAEIGTLLPAKYQPEPGEYVPPFEGLACIVK
jgi:hypothetical protein